MAKEFKVIKISGEIYEKILSLSDDTDTPMSELASKLIAIGLKHTEVERKIVERKTLVFKD